MILLIAIGINPSSELSGFLRTSSIQEGVTVFVVLNDIDWPLNSQVMDGIGAPIEVQEIVTEFPSITLTIDSTSDVVLALTACNR